MGQACRRAAGRTRVRTQGRQEELSQPCCSTEPRRSPTVPHIHLGETEKKAGTRQTGCPGGPLLPLS